MKRNRKRNLRNILLISCSSLLASPSLFATPLYWDGNTTAAGAGNTTALLNRTWGTFAAWNTDPNGVTNTFQTATLNTDDLFFVAGPSATSGNVGYTVTVSGAQVAKSLNFQAPANTVISGGTSITLGDGVSGSGGINMPLNAFGSTAQGAVTISTPIILNNSQTWTNNAAATLTTGSISAGTNTLTFAGTGGFAFNAASTFTGTTAGINFTGSGTLSLRNVTAPTTSGTWTVSGGGRLLHEGNLGTAQNISISSGYIETYFNTAFSRAIGTGANQIQFTGGVSGISENGDGSTVNFGGAGATLNWGTATFNPTQFILGGSTMQSNRVRNTFLNLTNGIDLNNGARTIRQDQIDGLATGTDQRVAPGSTITGNIIGTGGGSLTKEGVGRLTLSGTNTYNGGTTINGGTLRFTNLVSMPSTGAVAVNTGGTIGIGVGGAGQWTTGTSGAGTVGGLLSGFGAGSSTVGYTGTVGVELINATNQTYTGNIANVGTTLNFIKSGAGNLTLSGTNSYTGTTRAFAGTLQFANTASLYNGTTGSWTAANLNAQTGSTLAFNVGGGGEFSTTDVTTLLTNLAASSSLSSGMNAGSNFGFDTTNASGGTFTIANVIADSTGTNGGALGLTKLGTNTLVLTNINTYTGGTTVSAGTLQLSGSGRLGSTSGTLTVNTGGTVDLNGTAQSVGNFTGTGGTVSLNSASDNTFTIGTGNGTGGNFAGVISNGSGAGKLALTKIGNGTIALQGVNTYTGNTSITGGTLTIGSATNSSLAGSLGVGGIYDGNISIAASSSLAIRSSSNQTLNGIISGAGNLFKGGTGTLVLSDLNTYTGTTTVAPIASGVTGGILSVSSFNSVFTDVGLGTVHSASSSLGAPTTVLNGTIKIGQTIQSTATLRYTGTGETTDRVLNFEFNSGGGHTLDASNPSGLLKFTSSFIGTGSNGTLTLTGNGNAEVAGGVPNIRATMPLAKSGNGTWTLSGTNTYTGATTVNAGTLRFAKMASLYNNTPGSWTAANINVKSGATFAVNVDSAGTAGFDSTNLNTLLTNISVAGSATAGLQSGARLGLDTSTATGGTFTQGNIIANSTGANGGAIGLTKLGTGILVLDKANTYTGTTIISAGSVSASNIVVSGSSSNLGNAATSVTLGSAGAQGTLSYTGSSATYTRGFTVGGAGGGRLDVTTSGQTLIVNTGNVTGTGLFTVGGAGNTTINSNLTHTGGLTKTGAGKLTLSGTNTYNGVTDVDAGTLLINGSNTGGGAINVDFGATLGGTGSTTSTLNVSGVLSPGASIATLESGELNLLTGSTFEYEVDSSVANSVGADLQKVTGDLNLTGTVTLTLADLAAVDVSFAAGTTFSLINYTGNWNGGFFTFSGNQLTNNEQFTAGLNTWSITYNSATGGSNYSVEYFGGSDGFVNIVAVVVPEPSTAILCGLGLLGLLRRRRD